MNTKLINIGMIGVTGLFAGMAVGYRSRYIESELKRRDLQDTLDEAMVNLDRGLKVAQNQDKLIEELRFEIKKLKGVKRVN